MILQVTLRISCYICSPSQKPTMKIKNYALFFSVLFLFALSSFAQTPEEMVKKVCPKLYKKYEKELSTTPSSHYFLIDASGSVDANGLSGPIVDALTGYLKGLPDNDRITVVIFGETELTKVIGVPNAVISKSTRPSIVSQIQKIKFNQQWSDTYKGLEVLIQSMEQAGLEEMQKNVFFLTDFLYNSEKYRTNLNSENWSSLKSRISTLKNSSSIDAEAIQLFDANFSILSNFVKPKLDLVFSSNIPYEECTNSVLLEQKFTDITSNILKNKLRGIVEQDAIFERENIVLELVDGKITLSKNKSNLYSLLELSAESEAILREKLDNVPLYSFFPPQTESILLDGKMFAKEYEYYEGTKPRHECKDILFDYSFSKQSITIQLPNSLIPWWLTDLILVILLCLLLRFIWVLLPIKLNGMLTFSSMDNFKAAENNFLCTGKKTVTIGAFQQYPEDKTLFVNEEFSLTLTAKRKFFKGKCIELAPIKGDLKRKNKNTIVQRENKFCADKSSFWTTYGITIGLPGVK